MTIKSLCALSALLLSFQPAYAQGTIPTFEHRVGQGTYTLMGSDPAKATTTSISTVLVPVTLSFETKLTNGKPFIMDALADVTRVLHSPVFAPSPSPRATPLNTLTLCCGPLSPRRLSGTHSSASRR